MPAMDGLDGRNVVITGGAGALGRAVVAAFRDAGAVCHVPVRGEAPAPEHPGVRYVGGVDLTRESAVTSFYAHAPEDLWASVHLAGGFAMSGIAETSLADFRFQLDLNLTTTFLCCREAVRRFRARPRGGGNSGGGGGRIVNVASRAALGGAPRKGKAAYSVAKAGVVSLTGALAEELEAEGILVNAVAPGTIDTPANRAAMPASAVAQMVAPEAIARVILWLASPENTVASGAVVPV
jgi:NAD(P)-dependent dehydrogenase (short-subunit alcohol dehydrogenase family)